MKHFWLHLAFSRLSVSRNEYIGRVDRSAKRISPPIRQPAAGGQDRPGNHGGYSARIKIQIHTQRVLGTSHTRLHKDRAVMSVIKRSIRWVADRAQSEPILISGSGEPPNR